MTTLPINQFYSGAVNTPDEAVACPLSVNPDHAAADIQTPQEAIADLLEAIGGECRFKLDVDAFMAAVELPLFLRTA